MNFNNKIVSAFCITATIAVTTNAEFTGSVFMDIKVIKAVDDFGAEDFNGTVVDLWVARMMRGTEQRTFGWYRRFV